LFGREFACRVREVFQSVVAAKAANRSYKLIELDAAAFGSPPASSQKPQQSQTRFKISKKRAAKRAPKEALPQQGRLVHGAQGSAPRRAKD